MNTCNIHKYSFIGRRDKNEDEHFCFLNINGENKLYSPINLLCVFDGHGGNAVSKYLKNIIGEYLLKNLDLNVFYKHNLSSAFFTNIFENIQQKLIIEHPRIVQYCGSTACIVLHYIHNNKHKLWIINIGDSRAIRCNNNIAEQLSHDHKPNNKTERIRIQNLGGKIYFDGVDWRIKDLSLSRAIGDLDCKPYVSHLPEIYNYNLNKKDKFIIIACDGLWDVISNQEATNFVLNLLKQRYSGNYAKKLVYYAHEKGSTDNITVIIYFTFELNI
jgi:protein phosphatase 2C